MKCEKIFVGWGWCKELIEVIFPDYNNIPVVDSCKDILDHIKKEINFQCVSIIEYDSFFVFIDCCDDDRWVVTNGMKSLNKPFYYLKLQCSQTYNYPYEVIPFTYIVNNPLSWDSTLALNRKKYEINEKKYNAWGRFIAVSLDRHNVAKEMRKIGIKEGGQYCISPTGYEESNLDQQYPRHRMPFDIYLNDYMLKTQIMIDARGFGDFTHRMLEGFSLGIPIIRPKFINTTYEKLVEGVHYLDCGNSGENLSRCINLLNSDKNIRENIISKAYDWYINNSSPLGIQNTFEKILRENKPQIIKNKVIQHFYQNVEGWFDFDDIYKNMVDSHPSNSIFVEVGSWKGKSASFMSTEIINSNNNIKFYCVDTWLGSVEHQGDKDIRSLKNILGLFCNNVGESLSNINCIQLPSVMASRVFDDKSVDFVFIDADHSYEAVKQDIKAWMPKIKNGGYIGGHDINWETVKKAVDECLGNKYVIKKSSWLIKIQ